jgi:hypothetical protein
MHRPDLTDRGDALFRPAFRTVIEDPRIAADIESSNYFIA